MKIKNIIILIAALLLPGLVSAQQGVGSWKVYSSFAGVQDMVDTGSKVFYLSAGQLYSYDKEAKETYNYSTGVKLSDSNVKSIWYDYEGKYLVIVYNNSNIDVLDRNDRVYNLPDIKDADLSVVPSVTSIAFDPGKKIYASTNFGVVVFDANRHEVVTSGDYGISMVNCTVWGDYLLLMPEDAHIKYIHKDADVASYNKLQDAFGLNAIRFQPMGNYLVAIEKAPDKQLLYVLTLPESGLPVEPAMKTVNDTRITDLVLTKEGEVLAKGINKIFIVDTNGNINQRPVTNTVLATKRVGSTWEEKHIAARNGLSEIWLGSDEGVASYSLGTDNTVTTLSGAASFLGLSFAKIGRLYTSPSGKVYVTSFGYGQIRLPFTNDVNAPYHINIIEDGNIKDITPLSFEVKSNPNESLSKAPYCFKGGAEIKEDPFDPEIYYVSSHWEGLYAFKNREQVILYNESNSKIRKIANGWTVRIYGFDFDTQGNLWMAHFIFGNDAPQHFIHFLRHDKVGKHTTEEDWDSNLYYEGTTSHEHQVIACRHSNCVIFKESGYKDPLRIVMTKGTETLDDDEIVVCRELIDQDGKVFDFTRIYHMAEDNNGKIWVGTDNGVFEIADPTKAANSSLRINHLKVPRNDGSNFADYLLNGEIIYWIAVDHSNRKWIATQNSGVYLVSENGDKILEHFDTTNSPLPSDLVTCVTCGPDNSVYFGTEYGLVEYRSDSAPAREDFSEVYAYPNPVRPEFTGWITITGLMDGSLVKIADAAGNVFFQGTSEGGMITWDGCDASGNRVKTGVYYVFASHGLSGEQTQGAVTKILVVN